MTNTIKNKIDKMKSSLKLPKKARDALVKAGLVISGAAISGGTVAYLMSKDAEKQATEFLQQAGIKSLEDINTPDFIGSTPLMRAKSAMETKVLLELGADPKAEDMNGKNAILYTLQNRHDYVEKQVKHPVEYVERTITVTTNFSDGSDKEIIGDKFEIKGNTYQAGLNYSIVGEKKRNAYLVTQEYEPRERNTQSAINDDIEKVALLMKAGTPIKLTCSKYNLELNDVQKEILIEAGKKAGKEKEVNKAIKRAETSQKLSKVAKSKDGYTNNI